MAGAKALSLLLILAARLKSCPVTKHRFAETEAGVRCHKSALSGSWRGGTSYKASEGNSIRLAPLQIATTVGVSLRGNRLRCLAR